MSAAEEDFRFPHDVDGWLTEAEGRALAELARDKYVIEVGSYCGRSTICMAQTAKGVSSVDPHDGRGTPKPRDTYREFLDNLSIYGVVSKVASYLSLDNCMGFGYDLAFIDGDHSFQAVQNDIRDCLARLKPDGLLAFHDFCLYPGEYNETWHPGVTVSIHMLLAEGAELLARHETIAVLRPPERRIMNDDRYREICREIDNLVDTGITVSSWEADFLESVLVRNRDRPLSTRQREIIGQMKERYLDREPPE